MPLRRHNHLEEIISTLTNDGIDFIICGGVALVLHGIERLTIDLDLSVDMQEINLQRFLKAMKQLGLSPRAPVPAESLLDPLKREIMIKEKNALVFTFIDTKNPYRQVDVFLTDMHSYDSLKQGSEEIMLGGQQVKLVSKETLLKMKKKIDPPRDKDLFDIQMLEKILRKSRE